MMPVPRPLFLAGQTIASLAIATVTGGGLLLLGALFFDFNATGNLLLAFFVLLPTLLALYGFGFAFAGIVLLLKDANTLVPLRYEIAILVGFMAVMVALGYIVFKRVERHCRALGLIGTH